MVELPAEPVNLVLVRIGDHWAYVTLGDTAEVALQHLEPGPWEEHRSRLRYAIAKARGES